MKLCIASLFAFIVIVITSATVCFGQSDGRRLVADIPFDFNVKDKQFPAGKYEFFRPSEASAAFMLVVRSVGTAETLSATVMTDNAAKSNGDDKPFVSFNQYGGTMFLSSIFHKQAGISLKVVRSKKEVDIARKKAPAIKTVSLMPLTKPSAN